MAASCDAFATMGTIKPFILVTLMFIMFKDADQWEMVGIGFHSYLVDMQLHLRRRVQCMWRGFSAFFAYTLIPSTAGWRKLALTGLACSCTYAGKVLHQDSHIYV